MPLQKYKYCLAISGPECPNSTKNTCKSIFLQQARRGLGLALHCGWAEPMLDRYRDLVQHPNQPRPAVAVAADKGGEGANAFCHRAGGRPLEGASCRFLFAGC